MGQSHRVPSLLHLHECRLGQRLEVIFNKQHKQPDLIKPNARFPYVAYTNGGGAFLIPYICVLALIGRPLYLLELGLGQFSSSGSARVWDMVPAFRGETNS